MPRHPNQEAALAKSKQNQKKQTEKVFRQALHRLTSGEPLYTDGRLTYDNLWKEAQASRSTLNRYPEFKELLLLAKNNLNKSKRSPDDIYEKNRELNGLIKTLNKDIADLRKNYNRLEKASKQEIMLLNRKIEKLEERIKRTKSRQPTLDIIK